MYSALKHDLDALWFIDLWILNSLKSGRQLVALEGFAVWLGGYFLAQLIIFVFVDFRVFYERFVA